MEKLEVKMFRFGYFNFKFPFLKCLDFFNERLEFKICSFVYY